MQAFPQLIPIPGFHNAWQLIHSCESHSAEKTAIAMHLFLDAWEEKFGVSMAVRTNLHSIFVEYSRDEKKGGGFDASGNYLPSASYGDLTIAKGVVWVKMRPGERLCESSFVHELVHASIWSIKGTDGDPDHLGKKHFGWTTDHFLLIQEVNESLCRLGI